MQKPKLPKSVKPEKTPSLRWLKFKQWLSKHRVSVAIVIGAIIITGVFCFAILSINSSSNITLFSLKSKKVEKFYSPLTGIEVADKSATKAPVTGVMIENSPDARPQSGLKKAGVVYEAVAVGVPEVGALRARAEARVGADRDVAALDGPEVAVDALGYHLEGPGEQFVALAVLVCLHGVHLYDR